jgi:TRAP-type mannitol/chloroaromatic compound transport system permease small subunit
MIDKLSVTVGKIGALSVIAIVGLQFAEVILRYFIGRPTMWTWEIATYLYGASFMLAGAWALKEGKHVRTDFLYGKLSPKRKAILDLVTFSTIFLLFAGVLTYFTINAAAFSVSIRETSFAMTPVVIYPLKVVIAISFSLLLLQGLAKIARDIIFLAKGETV